MYKKNNNKKIFFFFNLNHPVKVEHEFSLKTIQKITFYAGQPAIRISWKKNRN